MRKALDSWALLAWLLGEKPAAQKVRKALAAAAEGEVALSMSMVNVGEVYYLLAKRSGSTEAEEFLADFATMPIHARVPSAGDIVEAARLKAQFPISYTDAFAVQTALAESGPLVTGDPELRVVEAAGVVRLEWIGA